MEHLSEFDAQNVLSLHCPLCEFQSHWTNKIESHFIKAHPDKTSSFNLFQCLLCGKISSSKTFVLEHLELQHKAEIKESEKPTRPSSESDAIIPKDKENVAQKRPDSTLGVQLNSTIPELVVHIFTYNLRGGKAEDKQEECESKCVFCKFSTNDKKLLSEHYEHHGIKNFDCSKISSRKGEGGGNSSNHMKIKEEESAKDKSLNPSMISKEALSKEPSSISNDKEGEGTIKQTKAARTLTSPFKEASAILGVEKDGNHQPHLPNPPDIFNTAQASETRNSNVNNNNQFLSQEMLTSLMLSSAYWPLGMPKLDTVAALRRIFEPNKGTEVVAPQEVPQARNASTTSGFSASQLAASKNFEHQDQINPTAPPVSSQNPLQPTSFWGPTSLFNNTDMGNLTRRNVSPPCSIPLPPPTIPSPTGPQLNPGNPMDFFRVLYQQQQSAQQQQEIGEALAKRFSLERLNLSGAADPATVAANPNVAMMAAAAFSAALSGFPQNNPVLSSHFSGLNSSPSAFGIPECQSTNGGCEAAMGLNLSTSGGAEKTELQGSPNEEERDQDAFRNRRRKMNRKREDCVDKNAAFQLFHQHQQTLQHQNALPQNQRQSALNLHANSMEPGSSTRFTEEIMDRSPPRDARRMDSQSNFHRGSYGRTSKPNSPEQGNAGSQLAPTRAEIMPPTMLNLSSSDQHQHQDSFDGNSEHGVQNPSTQVPGIFNIRRAVGLSRTNLPFPARKILFKWLNEHLREPYPSEEEKLELARQTGLSRTTVNNWFINARRRYVKPLMQGRLVLQSGVFKTVPADTVANSANRSPTSPTHPTHNSSGSLSQSAFRTSDNPISQFQNQFQSASRLSLGGNGIFPGPNSTSSNNSQSLSQSAMQAALAFNGNTGPFGSDNGPSDSKTASQQQRPNHLPWKAMDLGSPKRFRRNSDHSNSSSPADTSSRFPQKPSNNNHEKTPGVV